MTESEILTLEIERKDTFYIASCILASFLISFLFINLEGQVTNWITALFLCFSLSILLIPLLGLGRLKILNLVKQYISNQTLKIKVVIPIGICIFSYIFYLLAAEAINLPGILLLAGFIILPTILLHFWPESFQIKKPWIDLLILALWWITFDHRYLKDIWFAGFYYLFNAILLVNLIIFNFVIVRDIPDIGYSLVPKMKDLKEGIVWLIPLIVVIIPIGLLTEFIAFNPPDYFRIILAPLFFLGIYLSIAIQEELVFRGMLFNILDKLIDRRTLALGISAVLFGLTHWNNTAILDWRYIFLASIAGLCYGMAYWRTKNICSASITHALVDTVWQVAFS
ncbi:MAG: CPBP family intramembrane glutamic endopeptidase [Candidatus Hermodarchaeota archaeon]